MNVNGMENEMNHLDLNTNHNLDNAMSRNTPLDVNKYSMADQQYNPTQQGMYDGGQQNLNYKIPQIKGEKTIICWNCNTILLVKEEWNVVQCTNCEKINRIPNAYVDANKQIKINDNLNHFELYLPYVYIIVTCPFCKTDNKARKDAEHMVCYKCHNSISIQKDNRSDYSSQNNSGMNPYQLPSKSMRFSDMFFPDPMFYPGFYPNQGGFNPYNPYYNPYFKMDPYYDPYYNNDLDYLYKKKVKFDILKNKLKADKYKSKIKSEDPLTGRYKAIQGLLNHHDQLVNNRKSNVDINSGNNHLLNASERVHYSSGNSSGNVNSAGYSRTPNKEKGELIYRNMFTPHDLK